MSHDYSFLIKHPINLSKPKPSAVTGIKLAPFNPTHVDACTIAINMLQITKEDIVYDLGKLCLLYTHSSSIQLYMIELTYANVF